MTSKQRFAIALEGMATAWEAKAIDCAGMARMARAYNFVASEARYIAYCLRLTGRDSSTELDMQDHLADLRVQLMCSNDVSAHEVARELKAAFPAIDWSHNRYAYSDTQEE